MLQQLATNPHAPEQYRVNAVVGHMEAFHRAFGVTPADPMWIAPRDRVTLWSPGAASTQAR